ncbi:MAG: hypothetical protein J4G18_13060, partial [Anaerolineae bacterium]|nr:hypothetical protein [Anaerolineae bacterium]
MLVRQATIDDTQKIVDLFTSRVTIWQRLNALGQVENLPYDNLTIYERWLHGGAWLSLETGAIWLSHLLSGNGLAYVVDDHGRILAYSEAFYNRELTPLGTHLHVADLQVAEGCADETHLLLADAILVDARAPGQLSVDYPAYDQDASTYYRKYFGTAEESRLTRYALQAQIGQSFYKSQDFDKTD